MRSGEIPPAEVCKAATNRCSTGPRHRVLAATSRAIPVCTAALNEAAAFDKDARRRCNGRLAGSTGSGAVDRTVPRQVLTDTHTLPPSLRSGTMRAARTARRLTIDRNGGRVAHEGRLAFPGDVSGLAGSRRGHLPQIRSWLRVIPTQVHRKLLGSPRMSSSAQT